MAAAEKGGAPHFMIKEIREQPRALSDAMAGRLGDSAGGGGGPSRASVLVELNLSPEQALAFDRIHLVACGTSYHASLVGRRMLEQLAGVGAEVEIGSEYRYRGAPVDRRTLLIAVSQSGETADTLAAMAAAKEQGAFTVAICNAVGSALARHADRVLYTHAGPEISVASTKAFTTQLVVLYLLALRLGELRGRLGHEQFLAHAARLRALPAELEARLPGYEQAAERLARRYADRPAFLYIGRGTSYPLALEGALKLKEISYLRADGYAAGELKHGPIALVAPGVPVVALCPRDPLHSKMLGNIEEVRARGGEVILLTSEGDALAAAKAEEVVPSCPQTSEFLAPFFLAVPLQLFAYHVAVLRGCDVDRPRNLAKSVTVE